MSLTGIPSYRNLDQSGEAQKAADRMEARARAIASDALFKELVAPLLLQGPQRILEVGCGTAALTRRMAEYMPKADYFATDLSAGMLAYAAEQIRHEGFNQITLGQWNVADTAHFPFEEAGFDLICSSVMIPYLEHVPEVVQGLAARLNPGGVLVFFEQDLQTDSLYFPDDRLRLCVFAKDQRKLGNDWCLGLRPLMRAAGLKVMPRKSFLWIDEMYGPYTREMLAGFADAALREGRISEEERLRWDETLNELQVRGDFYYGLVYHRIVGKA